VLTCVCVENLCGSLYGPRANSFNFIKNAINQALLENKIERKGDGNEIRDLYGISDNIGRYLYCNEENPCFRPTIYTGKRCNT
jgi:nucleoside-diphosphate-sugar epimerase